MPIPSDFLSRPLNIKYIDASQLVRIFRTPAGISPSPIYFGKKSIYRFDCPSTVDPKDQFGVIYAAFDLPTCFAETVTRDSNSKIQQMGGIAVSLSLQIRSRYVADLYAESHLRVADVTDIGLYKIGAESGEFNSPNYPLSTQPWSAEIYKRYETVDGLLYRSRFLNGQFALAIFERGGVRVSLGARAVMPLEKHPQYASTLAHLGIALLP